MKISLSYYCNKSHINTHNFWSGAHKIQHNQQSKYISVTFTKTNSFLITCNIKGLKRLKQSYYPKLWHIRPPQSTYLGPVRDFAQINSLKQHFQIKSINIMTLEAEKNNKKGYNKCKLKDLLSHTQYSFALCDFFQLIDGIISLVESTF